ncbi:MurR/RpiR family transcriptional regulator [Lactobacillus selangorensis]|nr:MurR/RpiR family transcriptional regulator [Lactobacillus selangorensis]
MAQETISLIKAYYPNLSEKEKDVADFIMQSPQKASQLTIQQLSGATGASTATISRLAKSLGFNNFQALKLNLAQQSSSHDKANPLFREINDDDSYLVMAQKIFASNSAALKATLPLLSDASLQQAVEYIVHSHELGLYGLGASAIVAEDGYHKFLRTNLNPVFSNDFHMQLMSAARLSAKDAAIVISHTGRDRDTLEIAKLLKKHNVPLIVITSFGNSPMAKIADVCFLSIAEETSYRAEALHALIAQISLMDSLFMMSAVKTSDQTEKVFQQVHEAINKTRIEH